MFIVDDFLVVGIGASAGGIQALKEFFENVPADSGVAYVVILHLSPDHDSQLAEVLQTVARIPVAQVTEAVRVEPDHVYVVPPNQSLRMLDGHITVEPIHTVEERRAPVDIFFRTLAESHGGRAVCVVLSGTGANGSMGLKRVKERGGAAFVQNPREAEYSEMPRNSIATDLVDAILNVAEIPAKILAYRKSFGRLEIPEEPEHRADDQQQALREIFTHLRVRTGHDFSNYKRATVLRRIERRLSVRELADLSSYSAYLRDNPEEATALLKDLLISVTNFFRDKESFARLETDVLPQLLHAKKAEDQVRVWVAGCATGEEAYSIAMLLAERTLGAADAPQVQIFASDIDEQAIAAAREGLYTLNDAADVSPERLRRFFTPEADGYRVRRELRETILFAQHNLIKDPPFSRLDLVSCRNLLIYLNGTAQERVMETLHFALNPGGYLFLGSSESVDGAGDLYAPFSREHKIFQSREAARRTAFPAPDPSPTFRFDRNEKTPPIPPPEREARALERITYVDLHQRLLEQYAPPSVVVNEEYDVVHLSERAGRYMQVAGGEPSNNLLKLVLPELRIELRTALYQAVRRRTNVEVRGLKVLSDEGGEAVNIQVRPVLRADDTARGFLLVLFEPAVADAGEQRTEAAYASPEPVARQLDEELTKVRAQLRAATEQHELQSEELRASNEELQAINEELRSAAEELETSKEELQSVNEELTTVNQELKVKIEELSQSNNNFLNLINSTDIGTIFLDRSFRVNLFTPAAREIFNLIPADIGRPLSDITSRLEGDGLIRDAEIVLEKLRTVEREVRTTDGRDYLMRVLPYRTMEDRINGVVVNFVDITTRKRAEEAVRASEERLQRAINIETVGVIFFNNRIEITDCNEAFLRMSGFTREEIRAGRFNWEVFTPEEFIEPSRRGIEELNAKGFTTPYEKQYIRKDGSRFWAMFACKRIGEDELVEFVTDITQQKRAEEAVRQSEEKYRTLFASIDEGFAIYELKRDESGVMVDAIYRETNESYERLTGLKNVVGRWVSELVPNLEPSWFAVNQRVADTGIAERAEDYIADLDRWFSVHWSRVGGAGSDLIVAVFDDISERKERERRQEFLLKFSDALRAEQGTDAVANRALEMLVEYLRLDRSYITTYDLENDRADLDYQIGNDTVPPLPDNFVLSDYPEAFENTKEGTLVINDELERQGLSEEEKRNAGKLGMRAMVAATLREDESQPLWSMVAISSRPRRWTKGEIALIEEVAERTWAAVERTRAEAALRESEEQFRRAIEEAPITDEAGNVNGWFASIVDMTERRRAEEALAKSEEEYRTLFTSIDEGFCTIEVLFDDAGKAVDYRFLEANPAFVRQTGLDNAVGKTIREFAPGHEQFWFETYGRIARTGEAMRFEHEAAALNRFYDVYAFRIGEAGENRVAVIFNDIFARKRAEEALRESEERTRLAIEAGELGTWQWNLETDEVFWNERHFLLLGEKPRINPLKSEAFFKHVHPEDRERIDRRLKKSIAEKSIFDEDFRAVLKGGGVRWMSSYGRVVETSADGRVARMSGVMFDVTERKQAEEALRRSEENYRAIVNQAIAGIFKLDLDGNVIFVNDRIGEMLGYTNEEMLRLTVADIVYEADAGRNEQLFERLKTEGRAFEIEKRLVRKDGSLVWVNNQVSPIYNGEGRPRQVTVVSVDITVRKVVETLLDAQKRALEMVVGGSPLPFVLAYLARIIEQQSDGSSVVSIMLLDGEGRMRDGASPSLPEEFLRAIDGIPADKNVGTCCRTAATGTITVTPDIAREPRWKKLKHLPLKYGLQAAWSMPILDSAGRVLGTIGTYFRAKREPTPFELRTVEILSRTAALAIERERAEGELRESQKFVQGIVTSAPMAFYIFDLAEQKNVYLSPQVFEMFGHTPEEMRASGSNVLGDFFHPEDLPHIAKHFDRIRQSGEGDIFEIEYRLRHANGEWRWVKSREVIHRRDGEGVPTQILGAVEDVTHRKRAEEALRESEMRFRATFEQANVGIVQLSAEGKFLLVNPGFCEIVGYSEEECREMSVRDVTHPEDYALEEAETRRLLAGEITGYTLDKRFVHKNGAVVWGTMTAALVRTEAGEPFYLLAIVEDVTERKRAEETLRKSEERFRLLVESAKDYAIFTLDLDRRVESWNPGAEAIFGYAEAEIIGRSGDVLFTPEDREQGVPEEEARTALTEGRASDERWHLRQDGSRFFASGVTRPLGEGESRGLVKIARDLTERRRAEEELRRSHDELEERVAERTVELLDMNVNLQTEVTERRKAERERAAIMRRLVMAQEDERRRIARDMHDQFGQQLTALLLKLGMLKEDCGDQPALCAEVESLEGIARQLDADVDFLVWELRPTALDDLGLEAATTNYAESWSKHFGVPVELQTTGFKGDRLTSEIETVLYRIVQEALNNVAKHARAGGVNIVLDRRADTVSLIVEDDGVGFDAENLSGADDQGLGLAGMHERAALVGGTVVIETHPGDGVSVIVRIPAPPPRPVSKGE